MVYGTILAFGEAAAHELSHGTPFRTRWLNETAYWIACFMAWREILPAFWKQRRDRDYHLTPALPAPSTA